MPAEHYVEVKIENISLFNYNFIILLRRGTDEQVLPICIGAAEAHSIAAAFNKQSFPRPLTHDLLKSILGELDCSVQKIHVCDLKEGTFFARVFLEQNSRSFDIDSRPSDAIAVALRYGAPIYVREDILAENSVSLSQAQEGKQPRSPAGGGGAESSEPLSRRDALKQQLAEAVEAEHYEEAARIRDELKGLESDN